MIRGTTLRPGHACQDSAVSEAIGTILLVALVVAVVALVATFLFSLPTPEEIPNVNFMVGTDTRNPPTLYLIHNGGDILKSGTFSVYVDGVSKAYSVAEGGDLWSLGRTLKVPLSAGEIPKKVIIVSGPPGGTSSVIGSSSAGSQVSLGDVAPDNLFKASINPLVCVNKSDPQAVLSVVLENVSVIGAAMNQSPATVGPVIANVVGANSINFYKQRNVELTDNNSNTYYFRFNVTKAGSSISVTGYTPNPKPLLVGDIVTIYLRSNTANFKAFGLGDQIWEISASGVNVELKHGATPDAQSPQTNTQVTHAWIKGYEDLGSTLRIQTSGSGGTSLVVNGTQIINGDDSSTVIITNIRPVGVGLFVLEADNNAKIVYFVGNAASVTRNGAPVV